MVIETDNTQSEQVDHADLFKDEYKYLEAKEKDGTAGSVADPKLLAESLREMGYRDTLWSLCEEIDNSLDAGASEIGIFTHTPNGNVIEEIAVVDNGMGMTPAWIRLAMTFGGTPKHGRRNSFGRFGVGLPASCAAIGRRFEVYSVIEGGELHKGTFDLDDLSEDKYLGQNGNHNLPRPVKSELPNWLLEDLKVCEGWTQKALFRGTAVVISKVDRLTWRTLKGGLGENLPPHMGRVYKSHLSGCTMYLNDRKIHPVDPLFIEKNMLDVEISGEVTNAVDYGSINIPVDIKDGPHKGDKGNIRVRFSLFGSAEFDLKDKKYAKGRAGTDYTHNNRFRVRRAINGIGIRRNGRFIDEISRIPASARWSPKRTFQNNDAFWGCEIDFDPVLDELFGVTVHKQQSIPKNRVWEILFENSVATQITELTRKTKQSMDLWKVSHEDKSAERRPSSLAAEEAETLLPTIPDVQMKAKTLAGEKNLEAEAVRQLLEEREIDFSDPEWETALSEKKRDLRVKFPPYEVKINSMTEGPFYVPKQFGEQTQILINSSHSFFHYYSESDYATRQAIECLLIALSKSEIERASDMSYKTFYSTERNKWSQMLETMLQNLPEKLADSSESDNEDD